MLPMRFIKKQTGKNKS